MHVGQIYFDDYVGETIEKTPEYEKNTVPFVKNKDDESALNAYSASDAYDPFMQWARIRKDTFDDGLLAWMAVGVNLTANVNIKLNTKRSLLDDHLEH